MEFTDEERVLSARLWAEQEARNLALDEAQRAHLDSLRAAFAAEIAAATAALADLNRRTLRDVLRGALDAHPSLKRIALNQYTEYNDDTYDFSVDGFWLDEAYVSFDIGHSSVYDPVEGWTRPMGRWARGFEMGTSEDHVRGWAEADRVAPAAGLGGAADWAARLEALERAAYGPLFDIAADVAARLRTLGPLGRHFWVDGFGYAATIEATREELRITSSYFSQEHGPQADRSAWLAGRERDAGIPLGPVTSAYASDPARAPHVAVRLARTPDLVRVERELVMLNLKLAARALALPHPLNALALTLEWGDVTAVGIGPFDVPVARQADPLLSPDETALAALLGTSRQDAYGHTAVFTKDAAGALRAWATAVGQVHERFGRVRFSHNGQSGRFTYPH